jgi:hypothetical protein
MSTPWAVPVAVAWMRRHLFRQPRCPDCGNDLPADGFCRVCLDRLIVAGNRFDTKGTNR